MCLTNELVIIILGSLDKEYTRYGLNGSNYYAWNVNSNGNVNWGNNLNNTNSVRPAFYNLKDNMAKVIFLGR